MTSCVAVRQVKVLGSSRVCGRNSVVVGEKCGGAAKNRGDQSRNLRCCDRGENNVT